MAAFEVEKVYMVPHRDLIVIRGRPVSGQPVPGGAIELPRELKGPGWVPIADVQTVRFGEVERLCVVVTWSSIEAAPLMEFADLEGIALQIRS